MKSDNLLLGKTMTKISLMRRVLLLVVIQLIFISAAFANNKLLIDTLKTDTLNTDTIKKSDTLRMTPAGPYVFTTDKEDNLGSLGKTKKSASRETESSISSTGNSAGRTIASLDVSPTGAATYTVPISVPPGIGGVAPKVALTYNSQGGNGLAGFGWNISGVSVITRIPSTRFHDNVIGGVNIDMNDRFALDGQRLILKTGTYGTDGAEYQTENYSNIKVVSRGTNSTGPSYFDVYYPDGSHAVYGADAGSKTLTDYSICYIDNPVGIRISYVYGVQYNVNYITQINYGAKGSATPINQINFTYDTRQRGEQYYIGGNLFYQEKLLTEINVVANGDAYRNYVLTHEEIDPLKYERVVSIQELNGDRSKSFQPINFAYNSTDATITTSQIGGLVPNGIDASNAGVLASDLDGNGQMDMILYPTDKSKLWIFSNPIAGTPSLHWGDMVSTGTFKEIFPVNSLAPTNQLYAGQNLLLVKQPNTSTVTFESYYWGAVTPLNLDYTRTWNFNNKYYSDCATDSVAGAEIPRSYISGDFNGDGLTDIISINKPYTYITNGAFGDETHEYCTNYAGFVTSSDVTFVNLDRRITSGFLNTSGHLAVPYTGNDKLYAADFNGDGKTDFVHITAGNMYVYDLDESNNLVLLWHTANSYITTDYQILLGDFNGDGKMDILFPTSNTAPANHFVFFTSTGTGFTPYDEICSFANLPPSGSGSPYTWPFLMASDINGDGKTDIVTITADSYTGSPTTGGATVTFYDNIGQGSYSTGPIFDSGVSTVKTGLNLINYPIPLVFSSNEPNSSLEVGLLSDATITMFNYEKDLKQEAGIASVDQDGVTQYFDYKTLEPESDSHLHVYEPGSTQVYPYMDIQQAPGLKVVNRIRRDFGDNEIMQVFGYKGAVSNLEGLGFMGFNEIAKSNWLATDDYTNSIFTTSITNPQLRGAPLRTFTSKDPLASGAIHDAARATADTTLSATVTAAQTVTASNSITLLPGFQATGASGAFIAQITNPATGIPDGASISDYITRTDYEYKTELQTSKVFVNVPLSVTTKDLLTNTNTLTTYAYDSYYNVTNGFSNLSGAGTTTKVTTFDNSASGYYSGYYLGRPTDLKTTSTNGGDSYSTEEQYTYTGFLLTETKRKGNGTPFITEDAVYDTYGNETSKTLTTADGARTTLMQYDGTGRFMTKLTDIEGLETNMTYDSYTGNILTKTNPYSQTDTYAYDGWGRLAQTTDYLTNSSYRTYTASGSDIVVDETDDEGREKVTTTNAVGKLTLATAKDVLGQVTGKAYQYDLFDRQTGASEPGLGTYSQWNTTEYDEYGRPSTITAYTGKVTNITYSGLATTVNDGTKTVTTTKDALGNVISTQDPGGTVNNTYFANGHLKSADFGGATQTVQQDGWGRKTMLVDPSAGVYTYTYNEFGETLTETTPKGNTAYVYDTNGKLQTKHITGDATDMSYTYTYDGTTKLPTATSLTNTDGNNTSYTYTYDSDMRLASTVEDNTYAKFTKTLTYDTYGRIATEASEAKNKANSITVSKTIVNGYQHGQLKSITDNATSQIIWQVTALDARGQVTTALLGTVLKETNTYDSYGLPQEFKTENITGTPVELMRLTYSFDAVRGNLSSRSNNAFGTAWNETFTYDSQDRLTGFTDKNGTYTQDYDNRGRITANSRVGNYTYTGNSYQQAGMNTLTAFALYHYQNLPLQQVSYNAFKQPVSIHEQDKERIDFQYNGGLGRAHMYYGSDATDKMARPYYRHYSEDGSMEITEDNPNGKTTFVFYLGGDAYSAPAIWKHEQTTSATTAALYYLHRDYQGSILLITDATGTVQEKRQFDAWGNIVKLTDGSNTALTAFVILDRGYTGHEHLLGVGLINMNGRLYDPILHRFFSPDNFVQDPTNTQNFNRYGYVLNNPLRYTDKNGNFWQEVLLGAGIGVITNGIINRINGQNFFHGWVKAAAIGAIGGAVSGGIGDYAAKIPSAYAREAFQMAAHGLLGGLMTAASGGNFWQGFAAGAASSFAASEFGSMFTGNGFGQIAGMYIVGTISGGVGEAVAGGNFWDGARDGAISAGLNHAMHLIADPKPKPPDPLLARMAQTLVNGGFSHDQELNQYGRIVTVLSLNMQTSVIYGDAVEFGIVSTDKGWSQYYKTYYAHAFGVPSFTAGVASILSNNATFSDWAGSYVGGSIGWGYGAIEVGGSQAYRLMGIGVGPSWTPSQTRGISANGLLGHTTLIGKPFYNPYPNGSGPFSSSYINELIGN